MKTLILYDSDGKILSTTVFLYDDPPLEDGDRVGGNNVAIVEGNMPFPVGSYYDNGLQEIPKPPEDTEDVVIWKNRRWEVDPRKLRKRVMLEKRRVLRKLKRQAELPERSREERQKLKRIAKRIGDADPTDIRTLRKLKKWRKFREDV